MSETNGNFRTSVGGFNRNDVVTYISKLHDEHFAEIKDLKKQLGDEKEENELASKELEQLRSDLDDKTEKLADAEQRNEQEQQRVDDLKQELAQLQRLFDAKESDADSLKTKNDEISTKLTLANARNDALNTLVTDQTNKINDYEQAKLRVADIELAAYERAKNIEKNAEEKAANIVAEVLKYYNAAVSTYKNVHNSSAWKINSLVEELRNITLEIEEIPVYLDNVEKDLGLLRVEQAEEYLRDKNAENDMRADGDIDENTTESGGADGEAYDAAAEE